MDKNQFAEILEVYQSAVISVIHKMTDSWETARDLAQDTFVRLWNYREKISDEKPVFTLIYKIAINLAIDHLRRNKNRFTTLDTNVSYHLNDNSDNKELYHLIITLSDKLKPKQKAIFILRDVEGFSFEEIKSIMNMPIGNIGYVLGI